MRATGSLDSVAFAIDPRLGVLGFGVNMLLQELAQLNVARLTVEERWALMRAAEKASEYVVIRRDAINSPKDARALAFARLQGLEREVFLVILLNTQNEVLYCEPMFLGTIDSCAVHPREVATKAMEVNAAAVIFAHNHPSGHPEPSAADIAITKRLVEALKLLDVRVLDHLIVGEGRRDNIVSLAERGLI